MVRPKLTDELNATATLQRSLQYMTVNSEGHVTYRDRTRYEIYTAILAECFDFNDEWHPSETLSRVSKALLRSKIEGTVSLEGFIENLGDACSDLATSKRVRYELWTRVSLTGPIDSSRLSFGLDEGVSVRFINRLPRRLLPDATGPNAHKADYPVSGIFLVATGRFKTRRQAGYGLATAASDICALINLAEHRRRRTWHFGEAKPKATLLLGKYNFLFENGRDVNKPEFWYNPDFREDFWSSSTFSPEKLTKVAPYVRTFLTDVRSNISKTRIMAAVRMLHNGWESHDRHQGLIRAWSGFEALLSRSDDRTDDYDKIVDRACFFAKDPAYVRSAFRVAKRYRNRFVHKNEPSAAVDALAEFLDGFLIGVIEEMLLLRARFESHARFLDMLDLSLDLSVLQKQILDRKRAIRIKQSYTRAEAKHQAARQSANSSG